MGVGARLCYREFPRMSGVGSSVSENPVCRKLGCRELRLSEARMRKGSPLFVRETEPGSVSNIVTVLAFVFGVRDEVLLRAEGGARRWMYRRLLTASRQ